MVVEFRYRMKQGNICETSTFLPDDSHTEILANGQFDKCRNDNERGNELWVSNGINAQEFHFES